MATCIPGAATGQVSSECTSPTARTRRSKPQASPASPACREHAVGPADPANHHQRGPSPRCEEPSAVAVCASYPRRRHTCARCSARRPAFAIPVETSWALTNRTGEQGCHRRQEPSAIATNKCCRQMILDMIDVGTTASMYRADLANAIFDASKYPTTADVDTHSRPVQPQARERHPRSARAAFSEVASSTLQVVPSLYDVPVKYHPVRERLRVASPGAIGIASAAAASRTKQLRGHLRGNVFGL